MSRARIRAVQKLPRRRFSLVITERMEQDINNKLFYPMKDIEGLLSFGFFVTFTITQNLLQLDSQFNKNLRIQTHFK